VIDRDALAREMIEATQFTDDDGKVGRAEAFAEINQLLPTIQYNAVQSAEYRTGWHEEIVSVKGFDKDLKCRGFQFEFGKTYIHEGTVEVCNSGFHAISGHPLEVFSYYAPGTSRYALVRQSGQLSKPSDDSKVASTKITIDAELRIPDLVKRAWEWVWVQAKPEGGSTASGARGAAFASGTRSAASATGDYGAAFASGARGAAFASGFQGAASATGDYGAAFASGDQGAAFASGFQGAASASGDYGAASASGVRGAAFASGFQGAASASGPRGAASASGDQGAASATGNYGAASATGPRGAASASGDQGAAMSTGYGGRAMGADGCALFLVYRDGDYKIIHAWAGIVGQGGILPDVFYTLNADGKPVEVTP
jgi:hypothetical protein